MVSNLKSARRVEILHLILFAISTPIISVIADNHNALSATPNLSTGNIEITTVSHPGNNKRGDDDILETLTTPEPSKTDQKMDAEDPPMIIRKKNEVLSTDCFKKRNQILLKYQVPAGNKNHEMNNGSLISGGHIRLSPKKKAGTVTVQNENNTAILANVDNNEHIPQCTSDGKYKPIQCYLKMDYCWCVNKYGQAIKNSAAKSGEQPSCDQSTYESENIDSLVVTGVSTHRIKTLLRGPLTSNSNADNSRSGSDLDVDSETYDQDGNLQGVDQEDKRRLSASQELNLFLLPNQCTVSRNNAKERAMKHTDESIWIPECDVTDQNLYALKQCHRSKICWCVNQITGFPLRTKEPLSVQPNINCTEVNRLVDSSQLQIKNNRPHSFYRGFSDSCDSSDRAEFLQFIINQFRYQISDHLKIYPASKPPEGTSTKNPFRLNEGAVSLWKFELLDLNDEKTLDDREWSKFKLHFKLVDKPDDVLRATNQQSNINPTMRPLMILRSQRKCWRDFLECCGKGQLLINESIQLTKWLSCADLPSEMFPLVNDRVRGSISATEFSPARSEEAAERRKHKKNPLSSILKPD